MPLRLSHLASVLLLAAIASCALAAPAPQQHPGADVIVGDIPDSQAYGAGVPGTYAYDIGTTSCNRGNNNLRWSATSAFHPVIAQNVYRYRLVNGAGQFEQIGMSWVKHGFYATSQNLCGTCNNQAINGNVLGVGCSDPYDNGLNGTQESLGPRSEINPVTGAFPWTSPHAWPPITGWNDRRLQIAATDLTGPANSGVQYFGEAQYVTLDDASAGNSWNNISWRALSVNTSAAWLTMTTTGATQQKQPALFAWKSIDPTVRLAAFDTPGEFPGGRYWLAHAVTQTGPSTWHYEYCLLNQTSDRAAASITIPIAPGTVISNAATRRTDSHSGEPYSNAAWTISTTASAVTFSCPETFAQNQNASALRWGLTSTFRFDANVGPGASDGNVSVGLFKPSASGPATFALAARTPGGAAVSAPAPANDGCPAAQPLHNGENRSSTLAATTSSPASCSAVQSDLWFTYTYHSFNAPNTCNGTITFTTCGSEFDTFLTVYSGGACPANPGAELACNDDAASGTCSSTAGWSSITVPASEGITYLLRVGSLTGQQGNVVVNVTPPFCIPPSRACCANNGTCQVVTGAGSCYSGTFLTTGFTCSPNPCPQPPPPANDNCAAATIIGDTNLGYPALEGTNVSANQSTNETCNFDQALYDVWYAYTPSVSGTVIIDTCTVPSSGVLMDSIISLRAASCAAAVLSCNDDDPNGLCAGASRLTETLTAGTTYYIRIAGFGTTRGDFVVRVTGGAGVVPSASGACCWGSACTLTTAASCTGAARSFAGTNTTCNTAGNNTTPCCRADFDHSGLLATQDIFDFLNAWFAGTPSAAFAGDGARAPVIQDVFDFLNAWFVGC